MRRTLLCIAALVGALVVVEPATAAAPGARLTVKVQPAGGAARVAWLTCRPAWGTHPNAAAACAALAEAGGDPNRIRPREGVCTMEYAPVTLTVRGWWAGRVVAYRKTHGNRCSMHLATGPLSEL